MSTRYTRCTRYTVHEGIIITSCDSHDVRCCHSDNFTNEIVCSRFFFLLSLPLYAKSFKTSQNLMRKHIFMQWKLHYTYMHILHHFGPCHLFLFQFFLFFLQRVLYKCVPHSFFFGRTIQKLSYKEYHRLRVGICVLTITCTMYIEFLFILFCFFLFCYGCAVGTRVTISMAYVLIQGVNLHY